MQKQETLYINSIHRLLPVGLHHEKMCNPFRRGTADVWYSGELDLWVEYKYIVELPKKADVKFDLSPLQIKWLRERHSEGRNVAVIVGASVGGIVMKHPDIWEQPLPVFDFGLRARTKKEIAQWIVAETTIDTR